MSFPRLPKLFEALRYIGLALVGRQFARKEFFINLGVIAKLAEGKDDKRRMGGIY